MTQKEEKFFLFACSIVRAKHAGLEIGPLWCHKGLMSSKTISHLLFPSKLIEQEVAES